MFESKCWACTLSNSVRKCDDCSPGENEYCEKCFKENHSGISTQYHTSRDIKHNAIIKVSITRNNPTPIDFPLSNFFLPIDPEPELNSNKSQIKINDNFSNLCTNGDNLASLNSNFYHTYEPLLSVVEPCVLFESGKIKSYESGKHLADALRIEEPIENIRFNIVTFISKPIDNDPLPNLLLLANNDMKFTKGINVTRSPLCLMIYDTENQLLVLETQYMYKQNKDYADDQIYLLNLLLAVSDVIVFSEVSMRPDFIRIHEMMKTFKENFSSQLRKIYKLRPEKLAPALIYLQLSSNDKFNGDLPECIKNSTGRTDLFACLTKVMFVKDIKNINTDFIDNLREVLHTISQHRARHSLNDLFDCINNCKEFLNDNTLSTDIPNNWFLCHSCCEICEKICRKSFGHSDSHYSEENCLSTPDNEVYFCKKCKDENNGNHILPLVLKPMSKNESFLKNIVSYPFRGRLVECDIHGIIMDRNWLVTYYQDTACSKFLHKWPGQTLLSKNVYPVGQTLIDKVKEISEPVAKVFNESAAYVADVVKPVDWQSTREALNCSCCQNNFTVNMLKHHCRKCKLVICSHCYAQNVSLPICTKCYKENTDQVICDDPTGITVLNILRDTYKASSTLIRSTISAISRPDYWENDDKAVHCFLCQKEFNSEHNPIHHCRACGRCVCDKCSQNQRTVEWRCIANPSRICDQCLETQFWKKAP